MPNKEEGAMPIRKRTILPKKKRKSGERPVSHASDIVKKHARPLKKKRKKSANETIHQARKYRAEKVLRDAEDMKVLTGGRPAEYSKRVHDDLVFNYGLLGATEEEMAAFLGVDVVTFNDWKKANPSFFKALSDSKGPADARVAAATFHRAVGYSHPEEIINVYFGKVIRTKVTKHYPPDTRAAQYWLNNRRPKDWRAQVAASGGAGDETPPATAVDITPVDARKPK